MSRIVFADTFYYLALVNSRDAAHSRAVAFSRQTDARIVTTAWIVQELGDGLAPTTQRGVFVRLLAAMRADACTELIPPDNTTRQAGLRLFAERPDKDWSLTDCVSFVTMQERGIAEALTADHHFTQAGFVALLAEP